MTRSFRLISMVCALVQLATFAAARELSEAEYLASFRTLHPARAVLDEAVGRARGDVRTSGVFANPVASFERESPGNLDQDTWGLTWTPPLDGRRSAHKKAAEATLRVTEGERVLAAAELRASLREAFARWALMTERTSILDAHAARLNELVTRTSEQARLGQSSQLAAQRIELAVLEIRADAARADAERIATRSAATGWLLTDATDATPLRPALPAEPIIPTLEQTPVIGVRRAQLAAAEAERKWGGRFIEFPSLMFGWQTVDAAQISDSGPVFGVEWPIPIFDRRQGERDAADATILASRARLELETARVSMRLAAAAETYERLRAAALDAIDAAAVGDTVLQSAAARFEVGESDVTELLETIRGVLSARLAALDLYDDALRAHRELEVLSGRSWPTEGE